MRAIPSCRPVPTARDQSFSPITLGHRRCREGARQKSYELFFKYKRTSAHLSLTSRVSFICFRYSLSTGWVTLAYKAPGGLCYTVVYILLKQRFRQRTQRMGSWSLSTATMQHAHFTSFLVLSSCEVTLSEHC